MRPCRKILLRSSGQSWRLWRATPFYASTRTQHGNEVWWDLKVFYETRVYNFKWFKINTRRVYQKLIRTEKLLNQRMGRGYVTSKVSHHWFPDRSSYLAHNPRRFIWTPFLWIQWYECMGSCKQIQSFIFLKICFSFQALTTLRWNRSNRRGNVQRPYRQKRIRYTLQIAWFERRSDYVSFSNERL